MLNYTKNKEDFDFHLKPTKKEVENIPLIVVKQSRPFSLQTNKKSTN